MEELRGRTSAELVAPEDYEYHLYHLERRRQGRRDVFDLRLRRRDGRLAWVSISASPFNDEHGRFQGALRMVTDITARKEAELRLKENIERLEEAQREAALASRAKDEFFTTISHELRTPLTAMLGWIRMLRQGALDAKTAERALSVVERNATAQAQLVEDLLDVSRIVSGRLSLQRSQFEISSVIDAAIEGNRAAAEAKHITIKVHGLESRAEWLWADRERIQQVLWNPLSNAVKFTPERGEVELSFRGNGAHCEFEVRDSGNGISRDFQPHVFERFRQFDGSITRQYGGLGLGLAIVRHIVELHGGSVQVESEGKGTGSKFVVRLPLLAPPQHTPAPKPRLSASDSVGYPELLDGLRILVVDDYTDNAEFIRWILERCGAVVESTTSQEDALDCFRVFIPDVIVSDIATPETKGRELLQAIRQIERERRLPFAPAIILCAQTRLDKRIRFDPDGFQMRLPKPFEPNELVAAVASVVGRATQVLSAKRAG